MSKKSRKKGINGNGRKRHYYAQPLDSHTNEVIASRLEESEFCDKSYCADGSVRCLWRCSFDFAKFLWLSSKDLNLKYDLFFQNGDGPIFRKKSNRLTAKKSTVRVTKGIKLPK